jgi:hypothetical protein
VPKFALVASDRADAEFRVQSCIQVASGSKLLQATTYAAEFYLEDILYESQSIATFHQHTISAG